MPQRSLTTQQAAAELTRSGQSWAQDLHQPVTITYGFLSSGFGNTAFTERQVALAKECLQLWADVANINFVETSAATAQITFVNSSLDSADGEWDPNGQIIRINLASSGEALPPPWQSSISRIGAPLGELPDTDKETLLHEIGHALGLDHPGDYDSRDAEAPTYADDAGYVQDTKQYSVMSYFNASNSGANHGWEVPLTPLLHDMAAVQRLYGFNMNTRTGDDVYGFNSTTARASYTIKGEWDQAVFAIWDAGGTDTLDLSGYHQDAFIDLTPGRFSSAGGLVNNIAISEHVLIENAKGGDGNDTIYGNWVRNVLTGGDGNDILDGKGGADIMIGGANDDTYYVDDPNDKIIDSLSVQVSSWPTPSYVSYNTGTDTVRTTLNTYTLQEHLENVWFEGSGAFQGYGNDANNHLKGGSGTDQLYGYDRDDILDGGAGADRMYGGAGNDTYVVDDVGDVVSELGHAVAPVTWNGKQTQSWSSRLYPTDAGGIDEIATTLNNYNLTDKPFIENLSFVGSGSFTGVGNALDNVMRGGHGAVLYGLEGEDTLEGGAGSDALYGGDHDDVLRLGRLGGSDIIDGGEGSDTLEFNRASSVTFDLGAGRLSAVSDDGLFVMTNIGISIISVENVTGTGGKDTLIGDARGNILEGLAGDDTLDGGAGDDTLSGGAGRDTILMRGAVDQIGLDRIDGGSESDTLDFAGLDGRVILNLGAGTLGMTGEFGAVSLSGIRSVENAIGSKFDDTLTGSSEANTLDGGPGADTMSGGADNDIYVVEDAGDQALEDDGGGNDTVVTFLEKYALGANLENLTAANVDPKAPAAFHLTGNELGNRITSFYGEDTLVGGAGNDLLDSDGILSGRFWGGIPGASLLGDPRPKEEDGTNDTLEGGAGDDILVGGGGSDRYVFGDGWGNDVIYGFAVGEDRLDMRGVTGLKSFEDVVISQDTQGTLVAFGEDSVRLLGVDPATITAQDFLFAADGATVAGIVPDAAGPGEVAAEATDGPAIPTDPPAAEIGAEVKPEAGLPPEFSGAAMAGQAPADAAEADLGQSDAASAGEGVLASSGEVLPAKTPPEDNTEAAPAGLASLPSAPASEISHAIVGLAARAGDLGVLTGAIDFTKLQDLSSLASDALGVAHDIADALNLQFDVMDAANSFDIGRLNTYVSAAVNVLASVGPDFAESFSLEALREHFL